MFVPTTQDLGYKKRSGFTIIELLVVISIIATISSIVLTNINESRKRSRDALRVQQIAQVQRALELFFSKNGRYPDVVNDGLDTNGEIVGSGGAFDVIIQPYLSTPQSDPSWDSTLGDAPANYPTPNTHYYYGYDPSNAGGECDPVLLIHSFETNTITDKFIKLDATSGDLDTTNADYTLCPDLNRHFNE